MHEFISMKEVSRDMLVVREIHRLRSFIPQICSHEISRYPHLWTPQNPAFGCSAPIALLAHDILGGSLARFSLEDTPFRKIGFHWLNILESGIVEDFTEGELGEYYPQEPSVQIMSRRTALQIRGTPLRYTLAAMKFNELVSA